ncbi:MAG: class I SAM-dependent methyltransferase [Saprospiraceae bacterium]|nr:class I SAM-dependent methyltransferase [Saprospiraceae bacterium]
MNLKLFADRLEIYFNYYVKSKTIFQIHSPFIHHFLNAVFDADRIYYDFRTIEQYWRQIMDDAHEIPSSEFGSLHQQSLKQVKTFAAKAISQPSHYEILYRLVYYLKPQKSLELGSCLGMSSLAMALGNREQLLTTVEGNTFLAEYCKQTFDKYQINNIHVINLLFSEFLKDHQLESYNLVFLDGDHHYEATLKYSKRILASLSANSVFVLDDIHWSKGMNRAWKEIIHWPEVQCSLETQRLGFLFKSPKITKGNFVFIPYRFKPWSIGLFG